MRKKKVLTDILKDRTGRAEPILKSGDTARMSERKMIAEINRMTVHDKIGGALVE